MTEVHYFNPETDMALAVGTSSYTPPASIKNIRTRLALLPALYCPRESLILTDSVSSDYPEILLNAMTQKNCRRVDIKEIVGCDDIQIVPWGWNFALKKMLQEAHIALNLLPSEEALKMLRLLSHRRMTIEVHRKICNIINVDIEFPVEFHNIEDIEKFHSVNGLIYLKAPWSGSGRGIMKVEQNALLPVTWIASVISRQGSIMCEKGEKSVLDFASEWIMLEGKAVFKGISLFKTDGLGNYIGNYIASQSEIRKCISKVLNGGETILDKVLDAQKEILQSIVGNLYSGPIGIDNLVTSDGRINPCVELNMRRTMGHVALEYEKFIRERGILYPWKGVFLKESSSK